MNSIMIVEDEAIVAMQIESYIRSLGYESIYKAKNAADAIEKAIKYKPNIILMDINIEDKRDGIDVAYEIEELINTTIIYITAYCDEEIVNRVLNSNPVAYLVKPFNKNELMVALKMADKKFNEMSLDEENNSQDIVLDDEFSYDLKNEQLIKEGEYINLTKKEKALLTLLITSKNSIVSFYNIENEIWPDKLPNENTRRSLVSRLRTKLNFKFIETIAGVGYRMDL